MRKSLAWLGIFRARHMLAIAIMAAWGCVIAISCTRHQYEAKGDLWGLQNHVSCRGSRALVRFARNGLYT